MVFIFEVLLVIFSAAMIVVSYTINWCMFSLSLAFIMLLTYRILTKGSII